MKKLLLFTLICVFTMGNLHAQFKVTKPVKNTQSLNQAIPPPPPPPTNKAETSVSKTEVATSIYSLTSVRVNIRTGSDNKEFPSKVLVTVKTRNTPTSEWSPFYQLNLDNEMRINSDTEFGLDRDAQLRGEAKLEVFQREGLKLLITYLPNFIADAWKVENISLVLEFKDQFGNLHPSLGRKTVAFSNAYGILNNDYRYVECVTDGSFNPITAVIRK